MNKARDLDKLRNSRKSTRTLKIRQKHSISNRDRMTHFSKLDCATNLMYNLPLHDIHGISHSHGKPMPPIVYNVKQ